MDAFDVFVCEFFLGEVRDACIFPVTDDVLPDGVKQMGFAETDAPVEEKRVVGFSGSLCDGLSGGAGKFVVIADHERLERIFWIKTGFVG